MRTFTARSIRPADTTTPTFELDMSFRTMGVTGAATVDAIVGSYGWEGVRESRGA